MYTQEGLARDLLRCCTKCGTERPAGEFGRDRRRRDGIRPNCKVCERASRQAWRARNRDQHRAQVARYRGRHPDRHNAQNRRWRRQNPEASEKHHVAWRAENPEKVRAHWAVNRAVRSGSLVKPQCCECCHQATPSPLLHGHHEDYDHPLDVRWLCSSCHAVEHRV